MLFWMDDSKMVVKQNMLILVDNMYIPSNFVMFNWVKNDDLKLLLERTNPNAIKRSHKKPLFGNQIIPFYTIDLSSMM